MPRRKSARIHGYDYRRPGSYFVTSVTDMRVPVFGDVDQGVVVHSPLGKLVNESLVNLAKFVPGIAIAASVVMPNHIHAIVQLVDEDYHDGFAGVKGGISIPEVMQRFKSHTGHIYRKGAAEGKWPAISNALWQRSFHDRIIHNARSEWRIRRYIEDNPLSWQRDKENPDWKLSRPVGNATGPQRYL